ncbi:unnamed protein product, partial [Adineta ricciae]
MDRIDYLTFFVNGREIIERDCQPEWTLLWYLRNKCRLTGPKLGCGEGGCGACTVLISHHDQASDKIVHRAVNGCLVSVCSVDGCHITTVEGLSSIKDDSLHPIQQRLAELYASQCGFCTPGMVMALYGTLNNIENPTMKDIEDSFDGNLCRCTGYRPILDAAKTFACDKQPVDCNKNQSVDPTTIISTTENKLLNYNDIQCPVFQFPPPLLKHKVQSIHISGKSSEWYRSTSLAELIALKREHPTAKIVSGHTMVQMDRKFKDKKYSVLIAVSQISELNVIEKSEHGMTIGACTTVAKFKEYCQSCSQVLPSYQMRTCHALLSQLNIFGSQQIRNLATVGGNIMHGSPISSLNPVLQACDAKLKLIKCNNSEEYEIPLREFCLSKKTLDGEHDQILVSVYIPFAEKNEYLQSYKQSKRRKLDIPIITCAFQVKLEQVPVQVNECAPDLTWKIQSTCLALGSMAPHTITMSKTQDYLRDRPWCRQTMKDALKCLLDELPLDEFSPGGQPEYRRTLMTSFFFKFYLFVTEQLRKTRPEISTDELSVSELSMATPYIRNLSRGEQEFQSKPNSNYVVGSSHTHNSAPLHGTGEAKYTCDIPTPSDGLYSALVLSTEPYAKILSIDTAQAEAMPGFKAFISHSDVTGSLMTGDVVNDEEVFPTTTIYCIGTIIGMVVADSEEGAQQASKLIQVKYECLEPLIVTIDQAVEHQSYSGRELSLKFGDIDQGFQEAEHIINGEFYMGGQEHFYLETNCCMAIPHERGELEIYASTQNATGVQEKVAAALGIPSHKIVVHVKRIGGGFGGKDSIRHIRLCIAVSIAALKLKRPVRLTLDRNTDMLISG